MIGSPDTFDFDGANEEEMEGSGQSWMVSFADLMALLLTFMVVGFSMKQIDGGLWDDVTTGLNQAFAGGSEVQFARVAPTLEHGGAETTPGYVLELMRARLPNLSEDAIAFRSDGVGIQLADVNLAELAEVLTHLDLPVRLDVQGPMSMDDDPIRLRLAWERAMQHALHVSSEFAAHGLAPESALSVSLSGNASETSSTWLIIGNKEGTK